MELKVGNLNPAKAETVNYEKLRCFSFFLFPKQHGACMLFFQCQ